MPNHLTYETADGMAVLRMDDGKVNALSPEMLGELSAGLDKAESEEAVVVLEGREGVFSAGFDLKVLRDGGAAMRAMLRQGFELAERILAFPRPVVIACSGHALAMGSFLLLAADYRLGAEGPYKIGANEVAIGLTMPLAAVELCRQRLSPPYFSRAVINAEIMGPGEAVRAGFLDRVVDRGALTSEARLVASQLAALDRRAHAETKLRARAGTLRALRAAIEADDTALAALG